MSGRLGQHSEKTSFFDFSALFYFLDVFDCVLNPVVFAFYATLTLLIPRFEFREIFRCQWFGIFPIIQDGNGQDWRSFRWWGLGAQTKLMRRYYWFFFYFFFTTQTSLSLFFELFSFITYFFFISIISERWTNERIEWGDCAAFLPCLEFKILFSKAGSHESEGRDGRECRFFLVLCTLKSFFSFPRGFYFIFCVS